MVAAGAGRDTEAEPSRGGAAATGLSATDVARRVADGRVNDVPAVPTRTIAQIVRANVFTPFTALLGSLLAVILVVGPIQDALFGVVLVLNAGIGIVQEVRAKRTLDRLTVLTSPRATVVRDGAVQSVSVGAVVLDDILEAGSGDQIVVDGEVLRATGLEVDESLLTGESEPVAKRPGSTVLSGSFVVAGSGRYVARRVGREAYAVRIAEDARRFTLTRSELREGVNRILFVVSITLVPTAALLFWSQLSGRGDWRHAVSGAVAGTVAMVPEGLVLLMSVAFAAAVVRLARKRVLVQELPAVEGLARVDVLCIDKTGTLTDGAIGVESVSPIGRGAGLASIEDALAAMAATDPAANATMRAIGDRFPDPSPGWDRTGGVVFSSERKWSAAAFGARGVWVLGGADVLIGSSGSNGAEAVAVAEGKRALVLATAPAIDGERLAGKVEPVALLTLAERIRPGAADTLRYFAEQGVAVKVVSGDDPRTVRAIAERLGLPGAQAEPVDARGLPVDPAALATIVEAGAVFGRVTPQQKRVFVGSLQALGHTVAMTGDGVNDALALKDADIGVAMGSGTDATRAVAQIVLLDSDFGSLPPVVAEGRQVLGNIERTSGLYLTKTSYAMLLALATGVGRFAFPFLPRHLSLIAALTIGIPSFFLALAPNTDRFRSGFVRRVLRFAVPAGLLAGVATLLAYTLARHAAGITLAQARTTAVITLAFIGLLVLSIVAAPLTGWRQMLVWSMAGLGLAVIGLAPTRSFFALEPPPLLVWLAAIGIAAIVWSFARLFVPGEEPVGPRGRGERAG